MSVFNYDTKNGILTNKNDADLITLACSDTVHDFIAHPDRLKNAPGALDRITEIATGYFVDLSKQPRQKNETVNTWLSSRTNGEISAQSTVEDQGVVYFEAKYPFELNTDNKVKLTYSDIINAINKQPGNDINLQIFNAGKELYGDANTLEIAYDKKNIKQNITSTEYKRIGLFMLNYFFPPSNESQLTVNSMVNTYISFDAGSGFVGNIFDSMNQVINLLTPLNIADSAGTDTKNSIKRYFHFPITNSVQPNYLYSSNIFTRDTYVLGLSRNNNTVLYDHNTCRDFTLNIMNSKSNINVPLPFDKNNYRSGPSVNYLGNSIKSVSDGKAIADDPPLLSLVPLNTISADKDTKIKLLFDLKRTGDWEQCNAVKQSNMNDENSPTMNRSLLCTIDRLCAVYSRCIAQNTIWHTDKKLYLYRFPRMLSQQEIDNQKRLYVEKKMQELNEEYNAQQICYQRTQLLIQIANDVYSKVIFKVGRGENNVLTYFARMQIMSSIQYFLDPKIEQNFETVRVLMEELKISTDPDKVLFQLFQVGFFNYFSKIHGETVTYKNYQPFLDKFSKPFYDEKSSVKKFIASTFGYYDFESLKIMSNTFKNIDETHTQVTARNLKNQTEKLLQTKKYYNEWMSDDFSAFISKLINLPTINSQVKTILYNILSIQKPKYIEGTDFTEENKNFIVSLQTLVVSLTNTIGNPIRVGGNKKTKTKTKITGGGIENEYHLIKLQIMDYIAEKEIQNKQIDYYIDSRIYKNSDPIVKQLEKIQSEIQIVVKKFSELLEHVENLESEIEKLQQVQAGRRTRDTTSSEQQIQQDISAYIGIIDAIIHPEIYVDNPLQSYSLGLQNYINMAEEVLETVGIRLLQELILTENISNDQTVDFTTMTANIIEPIENAIFGHFGPMQNLNLKDFINALKQTQLPINNSVFVSMQTNVMQYICDSIDFFIEKKTEGFSIDRNMLDCLGFFSVFIATVYTDNRNEPMTANIVDYYNLVDKSITNYFGSSSIYYEFLKLDCIGPSDQNNKIYMGLMIRDIIAIQQQGASAQTILIMVFTILNNLFISTLQDTNSGSYNGIIVNDYQKLGQILKSLPNTAFLYSEEPGGFGYRKKIFMNLPELLIRILIVIKNPDKSLSELINISSTSRGGKRKTKKRKHVLRKRSKTNKNTET